MEKVQSKKRAAFNAAYAALNAAQKKAVDTIDGPVLVVAGPGTGKTQILTLRIANILLQTDTPPESILALTFTESGATAMRERLRRYIGTEAYRVPIHTFHGFAAQLIGQYPDAYQKVIGGTPASDIDGIQMIETILSGGDITALRPLGSPSYYVTPLLRFIGTLKQEYITPEKLQALIEQQIQELDAMEQFHSKGAHKGKVRGSYTKLEKTITKNQELLVVYRQYEALLRERQLFDFNDMLIETVHALEHNEDMLRDLQEKYLYVLADEHQDVNGVQNQLLELLSAFHDQPNIFAVGDEKQAIYRFQGASMENFLRFKDVFTGTEVITLTENYRSGQPVLDAAHDLVAVEDGPLQELRLPLTAAQVPKATVSVANFSHQAIEDDWLVAAVQQQLEAGIPANEIAVIVRKNKEVEQLALRLRKAGVSVNASAEGDILEHPITQTIKQLITVVANPADEVALATVLHGAYWGISATDTVRILHARSHNETLIGILSDIDRLQSLGVQNIEAVQKVLATLGKATAASATKAPQQVLEQLLQESGYLDFVMQTDPVEGARVIRRLYDEIEELVVRDGVRSLAAVATVLETRENYRLPLKAPYIPSGQAAVQVMTAHKAKGLEFAVVYMPHVFDSNWNGGANKKYFDVPITAAVDHDVIEDERRLLYVGMTRAKTTLHLSYATTNTEGKPQVPSRLLMDIDESMYEATDTGTTESSFDPLQSLQQSVLPVAVDADFLQHYLESRGFSATSINNYLRSPWDFLYRNVIKLPQTQALPMLYGTVVHNVLERVTKQYNKDKTTATTTDITNWLAGELGRLPITTKEYTELHEKALASLAVYVPHTLTGLHASKEEFSIRVLLPTGIPELPELPLTGKLDRLDFDESGQLLRVVDYKTGKPKTRNAIEGKTASSDGGYKRQLVFYALLLSLYDDERYQCRTGVLSFVEADSKGVIHEEVYEITDAEITELKEELTTAATEIISGEFLSAPCDSAVCDYCDLVMLLQKKDS